MIINDTIATIRQRRSIRSYKDEQIRDEELQTILEAGQCAPNAGGQAWHFTAIQNRELLERLNMTAKEAARHTDIAHLSALGNDEGFHCLYNAPTLIIVSGDERCPIPLEADCAAATENMLVAAESIGLGSCWIFFVLLAFQSPLGSELKRELAIPPAYKPYFSAVFGYKQQIIIETPNRKTNCITHIR